MADAEAFVCQLYNHGADGVDINEERAAEFPKVKKNRLDSLPRSDEGYSASSYGIRSTRLSANSPTPTGELAYIGEFVLIIQQIVTLSKYGHDALDICHP